MAVAFYIPDQANLLRKAREQERQILRMRERHWKIIATIVMDVLRQYLENTPNYVLGEGQASGKSKKQTKKSKH